MPAQRFFAYALCVVVVASTFVVMEERHRRIPPGSVLMEGEVLSPTTVPDAVTGQNVTIPQQPLNFLLYFSSVEAQTLQDVEYAAYLVRHYGPTGASFYVFTTSRYAVLEQMRRDGELTFPLIEDYSGSVGHLLRVPKGENRIVVLRGDGTVLFCPPVGLIADEDLRELYERFRFGVIDYPDPAVGVVSASVQGRPFPAVMVQELWSGKRLPISQISGFGRKKLLVFASQCPICSVQERLSLLRNASGGIPIFSSRFPLSQLRLMANQIGLHQPLYVASSELTGFENLYFPSVSYEYGPVAVQTDEQGVVVDVRPF